MKYFKDSGIYIFSLCQHDLEYHSHQYLELVYITKGEGIHYLDGAKMMVKEGDYFIIDYGSSHKYKTLTDDGFQLINCLFLPEFIDPGLKNCQSFSDVLSNYLIRFDPTTLSHTPTKCIFKDEDKTIKNNILSILEEYSDGKKGSSEIMRCRLVEILILTMRKILDMRSEVEDKTVTAVTEYVNKNYMSDLRLNDIANNLGMSPQYLSVKFKKAMGMTFMDYVQRVRIGQSCHLLAVSDKKIIHIAELSGYNDVKFFNRVFKKHMKTTPREFRREIRTGK